MNGDVGSTRDTGMDQDADTGVDASVDPDGGDPGPPMLGCEPTDANPAVRCPCMANIVCDQLYYCLSDAMIQGAANARWSYPRATCVESVRSDCEDDASNTSYQPTDYAACLRDLEAATCTDFGEFSSVSRDFPASCDNLRALDTGLSISR